MDIKRTELKFPKIAKVYIDFDSEQFKGLRDWVDERIKRLEEKAILKPNYNPAECGLNLVPKEGTFEWALFMMKKGKKIAREGSQDIYYFTDFGSLMHIHEEEGEDKIEGMEISQDDLLAIDWRIVK